VAEDPMGAEVVRKAPREDRLERHSHRRGERKPSAESLARLSKR
jgi:hypothetical protein